VLAEPAAKEREKKKQRLEDLPGGYDQERPEATAARDEDGHGDGGGDITGSGGGAAPLEAAPREAEMTATASGEKKSRRAKRPNRSQRRGASKAAAKQRTGA